MMHAQVVRLMVDGARLITITGQKGIGKTQVRWLRLGSPEER